MHVAWTQAITVTSVIIAMTFFVRARSLLPLARIARPLAR
ncbi:hypothetical protein R52603_01807 [Paraburkholderia saeva]|uniref:Uncharacterized protein n=1 Tax=Paraburkholderia saeva TaxID=2777537 RepID=A0A9N8RUW8_9BURK|nr:hypothetical protein LMG31841_01322 [Paraburkholderia saeva]CAG4894495.1 hypothetical protein R52603_01807 [Paraburkholderia saeva]CAG4923673.1 hypothetical protein R70241_05184 [Paraburkholderia saeva]